MGRHQGSMPTPILRSRCVGLMAAALSLLSLSIGWGEGHSGASGGAFESGLELLSASPSSGIVGDAGAVFDGASMDSLLSHPGPQTPITSSRSTGGAIRPWAEAGDPWTLQVLPDGLIYRSYLAGAKEPRFASQWVHERDLGWIWDIALGGRVGLLRYGTEDRIFPDGWQIDLEGAGLPRLDLEDQCDLISADFRFGVPITYGRGPFRVKFGYYHISSHLGDEYMLSHPNVPRINYARDALVLGNSYYPTEDLRLYAEAAWAFSTGEKTEPWEFQFGIDYSPMASGSLRGSPFVALNTHLREEVNFGGNLVVQTGWQWRGQTGHLFRMGMHYFAGKSDQFEFYNQHEDKLGLGLWYDY